MAAPLLGSISNRISSVASRPIWTPESLQAPCLDPSPTPGHESSVQRVRSNESDKVRKGRRPHVTACIFEQPVDSGRPVAPGSIARTNSQGLPPFAGRRQSPVSVPHHRVLSSSRSALMAPSLHGCQGEGQRPGHVHADGRVPSSACPLCGLLLGDGTRSPPRPHGAGRGARCRSRRRSAHVAPRRGGIRPRRAGRTRLGGVGRASAAAWRLVPAAAYLRRRRGAHCRSGTGIRAAPRGGAGQLRRR